MRREVRRLLYQFIDPAVVIPVVALILAGLLWHYEQPPRVWFPPVAFAVGWCLKAAITEVKRRLG